MNALLPKFGTSLVRTPEAGFNPGYWSFEDKQGKESVGCKIGLPRN